MELKIIKYEYNSPKNFVKGCITPKNIGRITKSKIIPKVAEVYSRPRVTAHIRGHMRDRIEAGKAYDIKWDMT